MTRSPAIPVSRYKDRCAASSGLSRINILARQLPAGMIVPINLPTQKKHAAIVGHAQHPDPRDLHGQNPG